MSTIATIDRLFIHRPNSVIFTKYNKFLICSAEGCILKINLNTHIKFAIAGTCVTKGYKNGLAKDALFDGVNGLVFSLNCKTLFVCDSFNNVIRSIDVKTGDVSTFVGQYKVNECIDGKLDACFECPRYLKLSPDGNYLYVSDWNKIRQVCLKTRQVNTLHVCSKYCKDFILFPDGKHMLICTEDELVKIRISDGKRHVLGEGALSIVFSKDKTLLFVIEDDFKSLIIFNLATNRIIHEKLLTFKPWRISLSPCGRYLLISDWSDSKIHILDISNYYINVQQFIQCQLFHHSFLNSCVIKILSTF
jgi:WD40 repeat protein